MLERRYDRRKTFSVGRFDIGQVTYGPRDLAVAKATSNFALVSHEIGRDVEAETLLRAALEMEGEQVGELHPAMPAQ